MNKIALLCASKKGYITLQNLVQNKLSDEIGIVISFHEINVKKDWYYDIEKLCKDNNISFYCYDDVKTDIRKFFLDSCINYVIAISWRYLIPLTSPESHGYQVIIFHDSLLPKYRGFAPTPNAIICGEEELGVTALFASENIDEGEIISQKSIHIENDMYVSEVIDLLCNLYVDLALELINKIKNNKKIESYKQNESEATYCLWRDVDDCKIDWNLSSKEIYNFVRAVGNPYPGAFTFIDKEKVYIERVNVINDLNFVRREPGKIWIIKNNKPKVVCGEGMVEIEKALDVNLNDYIFKSVRKKLK